jgi:HemY protein
VLTSLFDLLTRAERWDEALALVPEARTHGVVSEEQARRQRGILHHLIARDLHGRERTPEAQHHASRGLKDWPVFAPNVVLASELAKETGRRRRAVKILEQGWKAAPHPEIGQAFARMLPEETPEQKLQRVEARLRPLRPGHPELHLLLGELALTAGRLDQARSEVERAASQELTPRACRLMAEVERSAGNPAAAESWLARVAEAPPDHAWVCEDTGDVLPRWQPFGVSGRFDVVRWALPPRLATLERHEEGRYLAAADEAKPADVEAPTEAAEPATPPVTPTPAPETRPADATAPA